MLRKIPFACQIERLTVHFGRDGTFFENSVSLLNLEYPDYNALHKSLFCLFFSIRPVGRLKKLSADLLKYVTQSARTLHGNMSHIMTHINKNMKLPDSLVCLAKEWLILKTCPIENFHFIFRNIRIINLY